jgi:hypothetical protein
MKARYLILLTTLALLGLPGSAGAHPCPNPSDGHKHCDDEGPTPGTIMYTAELTTGSFVFAPVILTGLTANSRGTALSGDYDITMSQEGPVHIYDESACPDGPVPCPSEAVYIFNYHCPELVSSGLVTFGVIAGNWGISHIGAKGTPGHVYIVMRNLENITNLDPAYSNADFDFDLHGDVAEGDLFPPVVSTEITLTEYKLWAGVGGRDKILCNSDGRPDLLSDIKLKITRVP